LSFYLLALAAAGALRLAAGTLQAAATLPAAEEGWSRGCGPSHSRKARQGGRGTLSEGDREGWFLPAAG